MPSSLRTQLALVGILAVLLIPIGTSSLRGLTHVLTCKEAADTPFSVELTDEAAPIITSSQVIEREPEDATATGEQASPGELCGGLTMEMLMTSRDADSADITLNITNGTDYGWRGSVQLKIDDTSIPVAIGDIAPGETATDTVVLELEGDRRYELEGSLLIGP